MAVKPKDYVDSDRERILCNLAALLGQELASLQSDTSRLLPRRNNRIQAKWYCNPPEVKVGDLVICGTSTGGQQNPYLISIVHEVGIPNDPRGCCLRAIGTSFLCNYGNESFTVLTGVHEYMLYEGIHREIYRKVNQAYAKLFTYRHRFRGLRFDPMSAGLAVLSIGEVFGGLSKPTIPYQIEIRFKKTISIKSIIKQMLDQGYGKREFEADSGQYEGPREGYTSFTRDSLVSELQTHGIDIK